VVVAGRVLRPILGEADNVLTGHGDLSPSRTGISQLSGSRLGKRMRLPTHGGEQLGRRPVLEVTKAHEAAADQLEAHYADGDIRSIIRTDEYAQLCASLEIHEVLHRPNAWLKHCLGRIFKDDTRGCAREGQLVLEGARGQISVGIDAFIHSWISWMHLHAGETDQPPALNSLPDSLPPGARAFAHE